MKYVKITATIFAAIICVIFACCSLSAIGEDYTFYSVFMEATREIEGILGKHHVCISRPGCDENVFFVGPLNGGFEFTIYGVEDEDVLQEINDLLAKKFYENPTMKHLSSIAYKDGVSHMKIFHSKKDIFLKMDLTREAD